MSKRLGLRLTLPGAPNTPHTLSGLPGHYRPDIPTPVGGDGEITLELAQQFADDEGAPVELVEIKDVKAAEELADATTKEARKGSIAEATDVRRSNDRAAVGARERVAAEKEG